MTSNCLDFDDNFPKNSRCHIKRKCVYHGDTLQKSDTTDYIQPTALSRTVQGQMEEALGVQWGSG